MHDSVPVAAQTLARLEDWNPEGAHDDCLPLLECEQHPLAWAGRGGYATKLRVDGVKSLRAGVKCAQRGRSSSGRGEILQHFIAGFIHRPGRGPAEMTIEA